MRQLLSAILWAIVTSTNPWQKCEDDTSSLNFTLSGGGRSRQGKCQARGRRGWILTAAMPGGPYSLLLGPDSPSVFLLAYTSKRADIGLKRSTGDEVAYR